MSVSNESVRCMLLPLSSINLIVPNSAVAEVIGYSQPRALPDSSDWFPGVVLWRGVYIPVVSLEDMCRLDAATVSPRSRIAIIYNPESDPDLPYLGLRIRDIPRAYLAESAEMESGSDEDLNQYFLSRVDDDQYARMIPNLDGIIAALKDEFSQEKLNQLSV